VTQRSGIRIAVEHTGCHISSANQARILLRELPQRLRDMRFEVTGPVRLLPDDNIMARDAAFAGVGIALLPRVQARRIRAERAFQQLKQGRARSAGLLATIHSRAREICGILSCTSMHFQALSGNGGLPNVEKSDTWPPHNAGVKGSSPSLSTIENLLEIGSPTADSP
jgi:hypothetical protein